MGDTWSKIRDEEEEQHKKRLAIATEAVNKLRDKPESDYTLTVFDHYFAAALIGVVAQINSDSHGDQELVDQAHSLAKLAMKKRKEQ